MSYFVCSHCGERENIFDAGGGRKAAEELKVPFLGEIPIDTNIRIGGDTGRPIVESTRRARRQRQSQISPEALQRK